MRTSFMQALEQAEQTHRLDQQQVALLLSADEAEYEALVAAANRVRQAHVGDEIWMRGLIEFSSYCRENCLYCGLRASNKHAGRYRMTVGEILASVEQVVRVGLATVVLQSGEDPWWTVDKLSGLIVKIRTTFPDIAITLSVGERSRAEYATLLAAGANRFLMRFETSNPELFAKLHPGSSLTRRLDAIKTLRELGFEIGSGSLVGLPGQYLDDLAADLLLLQELQVDMAGIGPFIPHHETPLAVEKAGTVALTLRMLAVARLLCPKINLPVTTALATLDPLGREKGWLAGANVIMPNATPAPYCEQYELYPDKPILSDALAEIYTSIAGRITAIGRSVGQGQGNSQAFKERTKHAEHTSQ